MMYVYNHAYILSSLHSSYSDSYFMPMQKKVYFDQFLARPTSLHIGLAKLFGEWFENLS